MAQRFFQILFLLLAYHGTAQDTLSIDTVLFVNELEVLGNKILNDENRSAMIITRKLENPTVHTYNNLSDILQSNNYLFLKSYGLGSLATPSTNGTGASHTAVVWNGFNLQSPMNGTLDLALLPVDVLDNVSIEKIGASSKYGSGAVGGAIILNDVVQFEKRKTIRLKSNIGSFSNYKQALDGHFSQHRFYTRTRLFNHSAQNDFKYINQNRFGRPEVEQTNAALHQQGLIQENGLKLNKYSQLHFKIWYQNSHREIPPSSVQAESIAFQDDKFTHWLGRYQYIHKKVAVHFSTAYFDEYLRYSDAQIQLDDTSTSTNWLNKLETYIYLKNNQTLKFGTQYTRLSAFSEGYNGTFDQTQWAIFGQYTKSHSKYLIDAIIREEVVDGSTNPLAGYLKFQYFINKKWNFVSSISHNFRMPTFNDLYWSVGGNPDLEPERSWSEYLGISYHSRKTKNQCSAQLSIFNKNITNWILWRPITGGIWSPDNIKSVWSRGLEFHIKNTWQVRREFSIQVKASYDFTQSTNQKVADNAQNTLHQQLIYVPIHQANGQIIAHYKHFTFQINQQFVGRRYITTSNSDWLSPYSITDLLFNYNLQFKKIKINFYSRINNLWNANYEIIQSRPMPRRNFVMGSVVSFGD